MTIAARRVSADQRAPRRGAAAREPTPDDQSYLYRIIQTISAGPDLETILRGTVSLLTEATGCHACFVYFLEGTGLVLRAASSMYAHLEGTVRLPRDKGLTGWVATTRRSAFIPDKAMKDPRMVYVPEMDEERFQSMVSVPVLTRAGDVIGVVNLHTEAPREFARHDLDFIEHTASLLAGAIENAQLYQDATDRVAMLTELSRLSDRIALAGGKDELLATVTSGCRQALRAERAEIYLAGADGRLRLRSADPPRPDAPVLDAGADVERLAGLLWGDEEGSPLVAPLAVGDDRPGLLCVLLRTRPTGAHSVVSAVASHAAVALKHHELVSRLREENVVKDFFDALSRGNANPGEVEAQADRLGFDLGRPSVVLHAVPVSTATGPDDMADLVAGLQARFPGSVFDIRPAYCRALIRTVTGREGELPATVRAVCRQVERGRGTSMTVGVSNPCQGAAGFPQGFEEAASAADVGALVKDGPGVYTYEDLGPYRYALDAEDGVRDRRQERLERLVEYDRRRGTELLRTLEVYLESRGNVVRAARAVYAHPNTLRQRLARIGQLSGFDLEHEDWLSLGIAIKIVKLRLARQTAGTGGEKRG